jgi:phenylacetate-CoA ligase
MNTLSNILKKGSSLAKYMVSGALGLIDKSKTIRRPFQYATAPDFFQRLKFLEESQWWTREEIKIYQEKKRVLLVLNAFRNIPFYHELYSREGLTENDLAQSETFWQLPTISKKDILNNVNQMVNPAVPENQRYYATTGGTTGQPMGMWLAQNTTRWEEAFVWRHWRWLDIDFMDRCVICRGTRPPADKRGEDSKIGFRFKNCMVLSGFDLDWKSAHEYLNTIFEFDPVYIRGYPSTLELLSKRLISDGRKCVCPSLKVLLTSSELLRDDQRSIIEKAFQRPVRDLYGHTERAVAAGECNEGRLHVYPEYGQLEILPTDKLGGDGDSKSGEIVATGFNNMAMPLIRFRTGDHGELTGEQCTCGKNMDVLKMEYGRLDDFLVNPEGHIISFSALNFHSNIFDGIETYQYEQDNPGEVIFRYALLPGVCDISDAKIEEGLRGKLGNTIRIIFQKVDRIQKTQRGKHKVIISSLNRSYTN